MTPESGGWWEDIVNGWSLEGVRNSFGCVWAMMGLAGRCLAKHLRLGTCYQYRHPVGEGCCRRGGVAGAEPPHKGGPNRPDRPEQQWSVVSGQWSVVGGRWSVVGGRWSVVGGRWPVVGGQWSVVSGQWSVVSGQWSVVSGRWSVVSGQ